MRRVRTESRNQQPGPMQSLLKADVFNLGYLFEQFLCFTMWVSDYSA